MICNGYMPRKQLSMTKYRTCHWISLLFHLTQSDFEGLLWRTSLISGCHRYNFRTKDCLNNSVVWGTEMFMILDSHKACETLSKPWPITFILPLQSEVIDMEGWKIKFFINIEHLHYEWFITTRLCISYNTVLTKMFS